MERFYGLEINSKYGVGKSQVSELLGEGIGLIN